MSKLQTTNKDNMARVGFFSATQGTNEPWQHVVTNLLISEQQPNDCSRKIFVSPPSSKYVARAHACPLVEPTKLACVPVDPPDISEELHHAPHGEEPDAVTRAPDEPKKLVGHQEEPTEVTTVTKAPNKKQKLFMRRMEKNQMQLFIRQKNYWTPTSHGSRLRSFLQKRDQTIYQN